MPRSPTTFYAPDRYGPDESLGYLMKRVLASIVQAAEAGGAH